MIHFLHRSHIHRVLSILILVGSIASSTMPLTLFAQTNPACEIVSAKLLPISNYTGTNYYDVVTNSLAEGWHDDENPSRVYLAVETKNCSGRSIQVGMISNNTATKDQYLEFDFEDPRLETLVPRQNNLYQIQINKNEGATLSLRSGEELCSENGTGADNTLLQKSIYDVLKKNESAIRQVFTDAKINLVKTSSDAKTKITITTDSLPYFFEELSKDLSKYYSGSKDPAVIMEQIIFESLKINLTSTPATPDDATLRKASLVISDILTKNQSQFLSNSSVIPFACDFSVVTKSPDKATAYKHPDPTSRIRYTCDGDCDYDFFNELGGVYIKNAWDILSIDSNFVSAQVIDTSSPCYVDPNDPTSGTRDQNHDGKADDCDELLAPIPGFGGKIDSSVGFGKYVNTMLQIIIGFMGIAAVMIFIFAGVKYMTVESFGGKGEAKTMMTNALLGILVAASSYIILNTINPNLLNLQPGINKTILGFDESADLDTASQRDFAQGGKFENYSSYSACFKNKRDKGSLKAMTKKARMDMARGVSTASFIDLQKSGVSTKSNSLVDPKIGAKIISLNTKLKGRGIDIQITEAFLPTSDKHVNKCHYLGTCVDLVTQDRGKMKDPAILSVIIKETLGVGLLPHFESKNATDRLTPGSPNCYFINMNTLDHFSIYDTI